MDPVWIPPGAPPVFPPAEDADEDGLVALGGDLSPGRLLAAYAHGIFPWYEEHLPPLWWSPDPRAVFEPASLHVARRLARTLASGRFEPRWNHAFGEVIRGCREGREGATWLIPEMVAAYERLHELGHAHSVEVWEDGRLAGGLYGVQVGALFAAESMFHRTRDASKAALVAAVRSLCAAGVEVFDVQMPTPHLASMGAVSVRRREYLRRVAGAVRKRVDLTRVALAFEERGGGTRVTGRGDDAEARSGCRL